MFSLSLILLHAQTLSALAVPQREAIYRAAGAEFYPERGWALCYDPEYPFRARITKFADLNGDGRPEAVVEQDSPFCYGNHGSGTILLTRLANGKWAKIVIGEAEVFGKDLRGGLTFLKRRGVGRWPDILVRRVASYHCDAIFRFDGKTYRLNRLRYVGQNGTAVTLDPGTHDIGCGPK